MKAEINELIIDGIKWNIEYGDQYNNGWKLWKLGGQSSAKWLAMKAKQVSPLKSDRDEAKGYFEDQRRIAKQRIHLVSKIIDAVELIQQDDAIIKSYEEE